MSKPTAPAPAAAQAPQAPPAAPASVQPARIAPLRPGQRAQPAAPRWKVGQAAAADGPRPGVRVYLQGMPGVGKSTWAMNADAPAFIPAEASPNVPREICFPQPPTWNDLLDMAGAVDVAEHKTIVLDTIDAAARLALAHVLSAAEQGAGHVKGARVQYSSDVGGGYGKGDEAVAEEIHRLLAILDRHVARGGNVILLGHVEDRTKVVAEGADVKSYLPAVPKRVAGLVIGWADVVAFAHRATLTTKVGRKLRAVGLGPREMILEDQGWCVAKARYRLPPKLPLDYDAFAGAMARAVPVPVAELVARIREIVGELGPEATFIGRDGSEQTYAAWTEALLAQQPPPDPAKLSQVVSRLAQALSARQPEAEDAP